MLYLLFYIIEVSYDSLLLSFDLLLEVLQIILLLTQKKEHLFTV